MSFSISGGSSTGPEDHAPGLLAELGELTIHGVAVRPASPSGLVSSALFLFKCRSEFLSIEPSGPAAFTCTERVVVSRRWSPRPRAQPSGRQLRRRSARGQREGVWRAILGQAGTEKRHSGVAGRLGALARDGSDRGHDGRVSLRYGL